LAIPWALGRGNEENVRKMRKWHIYSFDQRIIVFAIPELLVQDCFL